MFFLAYNLVVPTPFYHLNVAREVFQHPELDPSIHRLLRAAYGDFLFGNTAPDVQTLSGQARRETHFFDFPLPPDPVLPWNGMLARYPRFSVAGNLTPRQAAFIGGYLCHLQADWIWVKAVFLPVFGHQSDWGTLSERMYLHNVLRAYLDRQILPSLRNGVASALTLASPGDWLPFVANGYLMQWHDFLAGQLQPGAAIKTVEVFAARQGIQPDVYFRLLASEERMDREVFTHLPRGNLSQYYDAVVTENIKLLNNFYHNVETFQDAC